MITVLARVRPSRSALLSTTRPPFRARNSEWDDQLRTIPSAGPTVGPIAVDTPPAGPQALRNAAEWVVADAKSITPIPPEYAAWYDELVDRCIHVAKSCQVQEWLVEDMQFYVMPAPFRCNRLEETRCIGQAWVNVGRIYLARGWVLDKRHVQHEMLHLILGTGEHPDEFRYLNLIFAE